MTTHGPRLSTRLLAVAHAVPCGAPMADIGTDHALVPTYLRFHGRVPNAIASDQRPGPLDAAARTLQRWNIHGVELRRGDGLGVLGVGEVKTAVIAGMGGHRIRSILDAAPTEVASLEWLVLQPNTEWSTVRRAIVERRWVLDEEWIVEDAGLFYAIMRVVPRTSRVGRAWDDLDLDLGPVLRQRGGAVFQAFLRHRIEGIDRALASLRDTGAGAHAARLELDQRRAILVEELRLSSSHERR